MIHTSNAESKYEHHHLPLLPAPRPNGRSFPPRCAAQVITKPIKGIIMGIFGWSLPPGCGTLPGEEPDPPCAACGKWIDDCICPECPVCGCQGDPQCYEAHGMVRSAEQVESLKQAEAEWAEINRIESEGQEAAMKDAEAYWNEISSTIDASTIDALNKILP
jgi:hypothetical protein